MDYQDLDPYDGTAAPYGSASAASAASSASPLYSAAGATGVGVLTERERQRIRARLTNAADGPQTQVYGELAATVAATRKQQQEQSISPFGNKVRILTSTHNSAMLTFRASKGRCRACAPCADMGQGGQSLDAVADQAHILFFLRLGCLIDWPPPRRPAGADHDRRAGAFST